MTSSFRKFHTFLSTQNSPAILKISFNKGVNSQFKQWVNVSIAPIRHANEEPVRNRINGLTKFQHVTWNSVLHPVVKIFPQNNWFSNEESFIFFLFGSRQENEMKNITCRYMHSPYKHAEMYLTGNRLDLTGVIAKKELGMVGRCVTNCDASNSQENNLLRISNFFWEKSQKLNLKYTLTRWDVTLRWIHETNIFVTITQ